MHSCTHIHTQTKLLPASDCDFLRLSPVSCPGLIIEPLSHRTVSHPNVNKKKSYCNPPLQSPSKLPYNQIHDLQNGSAFTFHQELYLWCDMNVVLSPFSRL